MTRYQVKVHDHLGQLLTVIEEQKINSISMTVAENEVGELVVRMPREALEWNYFSQPDRILTLERDTGAGFAPECGPGAVRGFFLRDAEFEIDGSRNEFTTLYAYDGNYLLDSRIIPYTADNSYTKRTDEADDMCTLIMRENLGTAATDTARDLSGYLKIQDTSGNGPSITKSYAKAGVLSTLRGIADASWEAGTYLVFDTWMTTPGKFTFGVFLGHRGVDRTSRGKESKVVNPFPAKLRRARKDERNYIYASGQGKKEGRGIQEATNATWTSASVWNRREAFVSANDTDDDAAVLAAAKRKLFQSRPRWIIEGTAPDIDGQRYGIDYRWGDLVVAQYNDIFINCHVSAVNIEYNAGKETVNISLRGEK